MATSTVLPKFANTTEENESEYYDTYEDVEETNGDFVSTTSTIKPVTNTFNLLNRKTTLKPTTLTTSKTSMTTANFFYYLKTLSPKYDYFLSTKNVKRTTYKPENVTFKPGRFF